MRSGSNRNNLIFLKLDRIGFEFGFEWIGRISRIGSNSATTDCLPFTLLFDYAYMPMADVCLPLSFVKTKTNIKKKAF
jgi:hypothetical protein